MPEPIDLTCYVYPGWRPRIRAASARRPWMNETPEAFAYRCLPMNIANAHGWELLSPCGFEAEWNGGTGVGDVVVRSDPDARGGSRPVALFGQGILTFHVEGIFRTSPGYNLWVGGPQNTAKDGIAALSGLIETDWSPYSFTMNWRFTRPGIVRFAENEPFCLLFPVARGMLESVAPRVLPIDTAPDDLKRHYEGWSRSRDRFNAAMDPSRPPAEKWQKFYYRGVRADGSPGAADHQTKIRAAEFSGAEVFPTAAACPVRAPPPPVHTAKLEWMLAAMGRLRQMAVIPHRRDITADEFRDFHYAANWPLVMPGLISDWSAVARWSPDYLKAALGAYEVQVQDGRNANPAFEREKAQHTSTMGFGRFIDRIAHEEGNDLYLTAFNSAANAEALSALDGDCGRLDALLKSDRGMMWIGPRGTFTPLHHDLTNNLLLQVTGRKSILLAAPWETPNLYNDQHVFSLVRDLDEPGIAARFPLLDKVRVHRIELGPGDALFIPVGWWHQVSALDFSVTITRTDFRWPNDFHFGYPPDRLD